MYLFAKLFFRVLSFVTLVFEVCGGGRNTLTIDWSYLKFHDLRINLIKTTSGFERTYLSSL